MRMLMTVMAVLPDLSLWWSKRWIHSGVVASQEVMDGIIGLDMW